MAEENKQQLLTVTIDGHTTQVPAGTTILQAARSIGKEVAPSAMCYYGKLENTGGNCRTCMVEVTKGSDADPRPMPKLVASCRTTVMDGMVVGNKTSERAVEARKGVVEFLLINHPLDCPVCDQAGECKLQDLGYEHGEEATRYDFERRTFAPEDLGPNIQLHMNRCILCYRCVKTADQITGCREHGVMFRGDHAEISTYLNKTLDNEFIGNIIDVCPVGALTDKTFRFKNRVWFLNPVDAHRDCPTCSGKAQIWFRGEEVFRVTARKNEWNEVEDWICNTCRFEKKDINDWTLEKPSDIAKDSVIRANHYTINKVKPKETLPKVIHRDPKVLLDIHTVSEVNEPNRNLSKIHGPATSKDFKN
ncbi:2Fe-2S iron-sulfur cluster-binding protein [Weeksella virosa]|uniref:2Fe-2S iron-sulfur cluster-binding protein n=1 Tax=Weeksella virosa TaxID=1014 RepID=UPI00255506BA|nr:2Fe-2S iron-sulfur cluster-binding protein [Weeksella virosa]MDK7375288.1 2Fe-2S iron-sulfur cluster-binding protein [Weeksella virosa]